MSYFAVNYLAVLVAALVPMLVGGLWYSKMLFAGAWMAEAGLKEEELTNPAPAMIKSVIASLVLAYGLAILMKHMGVADLKAGALTGFFTAILIVGGASFPNYAFEGKSIRHFAIHMGATLVGMTAMGAILGAWQ